METAGLGLTLERAAGSLLVFVESRRPRDENSPLPEDAGPVTGKLPVSLMSQVSPMSPRRRAEFATGRWCAREALGRLGVPAVSIPKGPDGAPVWPRGVTGSISHTEGLVIAVASCSHRSVGVDVQSRDVRVDPGSWEHLSNPAAVQSLMDLDIPSDLANMLVFSLQEAAFKCLFPVFGRPVTFRHIHLDFPGEAGRVTLLVRMDKMPGSLPWVSLEGCYAWDERHVLAATWMPAGQ